MSMHLERSPPQRLDATAINQPSLQGIDGVLETGPVSESLDVERRQHLLNANVCDTVS